MSLLFKSNVILLNPDLAFKIGLNETIVLQQVYYWLEKKQNFVDGKYWVYNSYPQWKKQFPFFSEDSIYRSFKKLEQLNLIISKQMSADVRDRTKWYTINFETLKKIELEIEHEQKEDTSARCISAICGDGQPQFAEMDNRNLRRCFLYTETTNRDYTDIKQCPNCEKGPISAEMGIPSIDLTADNDSYSNKFKIDVKGKENGNRTIIKNFNDADASKTKNKAQGDVLDSKPISEVIKSKKTLPVPYIEGFEKFWEAYPLKVGKKNALKAWNKNIKDTNIQLILNVIEKKKSERKLKEKYGVWIEAWKHPATWLNSGGWDDGIESEEEIINHAQAHWRNRMSYRDYQQIQHQLTPEGQESLQREERMKERMRRIREEHKKSGENK